MLMASDWSVVMFWSCAAGVAFAYLGYPAVIGALSRVFGETPAAPRCLDQDLPRLALIVAAYNEEHVIEGRIRNAMEQNYPCGRLTIVVASDGSTDRTGEIVRRFADQGVLLIEDPIRRGKAAVLNRAMASVDAEVVLLSDANTHFAPDVARDLARWFVDPRVGVVCGRLVLQDPLSGRNVDGLYWRFENYLKRCESRLGALLGANGAVYAIRRDAYVPIPDGTIVDDFVIPLISRLRTGLELVYDEESVAFEESAPHLGSEFRRRCRIGAGDFQSLGLLWPLLDPRRGWIALAFASHKVLRWTCPFLLLGMAAISLSWRDLTPYREALWAQTAFYALALAAAIAPAGLRIPRPLRLAAMFAGMNAALFIGFFRWLFGLQAATWARTDRLGETGGTS